VTHCHFEANASPGFGGAIYIDLATPDGSNMRIDSCYFYRNTALQGGAIYSSVEIKIVNSTFAGNHASLGSEIYLNVPTGGNTTFVGCTFQGNWNYQSRLPTGIFCLLGSVIFEDSFFRNLRGVTMLHFKTL